MLAKACTPLAPTSSVARELHVPFCNEDFHPNLPVWCGRFYHLHTFGADVFGQFWPLLARFWVFFCDLLVLAVLDAWGSHWQKHWGGRGGHFAALIFKIGPGALNFEIFFWI